MKRAETTGARWTPSSVLVVEDDEFAATMASTHLVQLGVPRITVSRDAVDALVKVDRDRFDLALVDLRMPGMDGFALLRQFAAVRFDGAVILISGEDKRLLKAAEDVAAALGLDVLGALRKPYAIGEVEALFAIVGGGGGARRRASGWQPSEQDLSMALAQRQLALVFQPKVDMRTGVFCGTEALVRWHHPGRGVVGPDKFIPLAERHGLIDTLTDQVLDMATDQARKWREAGMPGPISVNLSMENLRRAELPDELGRLLQRKGLAPSALMLEITETMLIEHFELALEVLSRMSLMGIALSIDDFGTGYSSMMKLKRIPFQELKVDRAFVHGAQNDEAARAILQSSVDLARMLKMAVVAEGIENLADWSVAAGAGVDTAQGYFLARPMEAGLMAAFVADLPDWWRGNLAEAPSDVS